MLHCSSLCCSKRRIKIARSYAKILPKEPLALSVSRQQRTPPKGVRMAIRLHVTCGVVPVLASSVISCDTTLEASAVVLFCSVRLVRQGSDKPGGHLPTQPLSLSALQCSASVDSIMPEPSGVQLQRFRLKNFTKICLLVRLGAQKLYPNSGTIFCCSVRHSIIDWRVECEI
ncbi:hypothetical protein HNQ38_002275 [Desulfovibrio intestinalis]|uniref:Uncharacterized protein n=1 Tax=Desulfovibrio intestinalis TaxID=58621 RepID=A0A7W8FHS7_9BACT|nr:hypothetical protein [Desulfovibrio intestinalis]